MITSKDNPRLKLVRALQRKRERAETGLGETVFVIGLGLIGQLAVAILNAAGCRVIGTDLDAAKRILGDLAGYFPFPGRAIGHPTRLEGSAALVAEHSRKAQAMGCGGVDLLAYRATEADPLDLVRAARAALPGRKLIVAGSISTTEASSTGR